jgi:hypothetical protein
MLYKSNLGGRTVPAPQLQFVHTRKCLLQIMTRVRHVYLWYTRYDCCKNPTTVDAPYRFHSCTLFTRNVYLKSWHASQVHRSIVGYFTNCEYVFQREMLLRTWSRDFLPFVTTWRNHVSSRELSNKCQCCVWDDYHTDLNAYSTNRQKNENR